MSHIIVLRGENTGSVSLRLDHGSVDGPPTITPLSKLFAGEAYTLESQAGATALAEFVNGLSLGEADYVITVTDSTGRVELTSALTTTLAGARTSAMVAASAVARLTDSRPATVTVTITKDGEVIASRTGREARGKPPGPTEENPS